MTYDLTKLSRTIAHALRHDPALYGLELDAEGWVTVDDLIAGIRRHKPYYRELTATDLWKVQENNDKPRYEIQAGKIRALHGHSVEQKISYTPTTTPDLLYHGTNSNALAIIRKEGLKPMNRQYVHLSAETDMAQKVGSRRKGDTVILVIQAAQAHAAGIAFYQSSEVVWLVDSLPAEFIDIPNL